MATTKSINSAIIEGIRGWSKSAGEGPLSQLGMGRDVRENNLEEKARSLCIYHNIWNEPSLLKLETEIIEAGHIILNMFSLCQISQDIESPSPHFPTSPAHP